MTQNHSTNSNTFEETVVEGLRAIYKQISIQNQLLERIAIASERTAESVAQMVSSNTTAPNLTAPLESFATFDWSSLGATVERSDQYGAAIVNWKGMQFVRRSPSNKYEPSVWYSRSVGRDDDGNNKYERLITFKSVARLEVEPLPEKVQKIYNSNDNF